jgi:hypothetical protein
VVFESVPDGVLLLFVQLVLTNPWLFYDPRCSLSCLWLQTFNFTMDQKTHLHGTWDLETLK